MIRRSIDPNSIINLARQQSRPPICPSGSLDYETTAALGLQVHSADKQEEGAPTLASYVIGFACSRSPKTESACRPPSCDVAVWRAKDVGGQENGHQRNSWRLWFLPPQVVYLNAGPRPTLLTATAMNLCLSTSASSLSPVFGQRAYSPATPPAHLSPMSHSMEYNPVGASSYTTHRERDSMSPCLGHVIRSCDLFSQKILSKIHI